MSALLVCACHLMPVCVRVCWAVLCDEVARWWETQSSFTNLEVRAAVCLCFLVAGHPRFIHYLKSCCNSVWDLKHDNTFLYLRKREWELTEVCFNEVFVCLTSSRFFVIRLWLHMKESERKNQTDWPGRVWGLRSLCLRRTNRTAQDECFKLKLKQFWGLQEMIVKMTVAEGYPVQWAWLTAQLTTSKGFCWTDRSERDVV